jgi:acyl-CoA synthetase (AMP-forming)/AMP-acid ligase II
VSERRALAFEQREYSVPQLNALANGMATVLEHRGVRPGDRVALMSSNRPEFVIALWAIWRLGASVVLLSPAWKRTEVESALSLTTPSHAVGDHPVLAELMPMLSLDEAITPGQRTFEAPAPESDALFVFSSGTTGMPKAVRHRTGDVGYVDVGGWLRITDRAKEMIKVRGFQVAPAEIEAVLHGHPAVEDCAVFGVPDAANGEAIVAAVKRCGPVEVDELIALVGDRLASYKRPNRAVFVDEIPRLPSGKVLRRVLKEREWTSV